MTDRPKLRLGALRPRVFAERLAAATTARA
jgi:hypothetical protein